MLASGIRLLTDPSLSTAFASGCPRSIRAPLASWQEGAFAGLRLLRAGQEGCHSRTVVLWTLLESTGSRMMDLWRSEEMQLVQVGSGDEDGHPFLEPPP